MLVWILLCVVLAWLYKHVSIIQKVTFLNLDQRQVQLHSNARLLDVRDASDYEKENVPTAINIPVGRLPFVWEKELSPDDTIVILTDRFYRGKKGARILSKRGFRNLYILVGTVPELHEWFNTKN